jgi:hypothetical protein
MQVYMCHRCADTPLALGIFVKLSTYHFIQREGSAAGQAYFQKDSKWYVLSLRYLNHSGVHILYSHRLINPKVYGDRKAV